MIFGLGVSTAGLLAIWSLASTSKWHPTDLDVILAHPSQSFHHYVWVAIFRTIVAGVGNILYGGFCRIAVAHGLFGHIDAL